MSDEKLYVFYEVNYFFAAGAVALPQMESLIWSHGVYL